MKEFGNSAKQEIGRWANNRVENSDLHSDDGSEHAEGQANEDLAEVRLGPRRCSQPLQLRTAPRQSTNLQGPTLGHIGRVAQPYSLNIQVKDQTLPIGDRCALV